MYIQRVKIKNFRSLTDVEINLKDYTAVVGLNDSGKSNFLRALNLFFNDQTDVGSALLFEKDFSQQAKIIGKKARQIEIEVEFSPPNNYADSDPVIWQKIYRADLLTPFQESIFRTSGKDFSKGSRTEYWVRHIAFEYVPAIRGKAFFATLKRRLYNTLAETVAPKLTLASGTFLADLRKEVKKIESESHRLLQLKTEFSLPVDLGDFFEMLDFDSADDHSSTALQYRGDGIQGRHIPLILKFLADQRKSNSAKGKPPSETIWGFEEPENNLELTKQIETADEFAEYAKSVQILVTTHSPAFYGKAKQAGGICVASREAGKTSFSENISAEKMDAHLGLMPFIQPYIEKAVEERKKLIATVKELKAQSLVLDKPVLYVEGSSDKLIIDAVLNATAGEHKDAFEVVAKDGLGGGVNWIVGCCVARAAMIDLNRKTAALLDDDSAGQEGAKKIDEYGHAINRHGKIKCIFVGKSNADDEIRKIKKSGIVVPFAIDELCGASAWEFAETKGWLIERGEEMLVSNVKLLKKDKTFSDVISGKIDDPHARRLIEYKLDGIRKGSFAKHVAKAIDDGAEIPKSLMVLVQQIRDYFGN
ncbi:ATP-dependent nuclease [Burkholderia sp. KBS0801]|uniref:ATP-dependent nuclease n=1 Tax=Burkholderia sp. KBS0801 TaxID=1179675 RepID=UPI00110E1BDC|nr:AAA family ATPase [Burkholderia sp. KBS0801]QDW50026.1 ATP-binding protein [Burkholderia sp. KBS0801]